MGLFGKKEEIKPFNSLEYLKGIHMAGLPVPEGMWCNLYLHDDRIVFSDGNNMYNLTMDKIVDVALKTETEIQQAYVSSAGGAVGGALLFGPLGAIIGGRAKKKTTKTVNHFLIFTYKNGDTVGYISFDVTGWVSIARSVEMQVAIRIQKNGSTGNMIDL